LLEEHWGELPQRHSPLELQVVARSGSQTTHAPPPTPQWAMLEV
jgi:hypothetical protein